MGREDLSPSEDKLDHDGLTHSFADQIIFKERLAAIEAGSIAQLAIEENLVHKPAADTVHEKT